MTNTLIMSSKYLNEKTNLNLYKKQIKEFLENTIPSETSITMGKMKNIPMINFITSIGYTISVKNQSLPSLYNSNKKLIREHDMIIFIVIDDSPHMSEFIEYSKEFTTKIIKILNI